MTYVSKNNTYLKYLCSVEGLMLLVWSATLKQIKE